jgi:hypothetical protein
MERNKTLAIVTASTLLLSGCSSGENNKVDDNSYPLSNSQPVYPSETAANAREGECATLERAVDVTPSDTRDVGGWLILKITTSDINDSLTPNTCPDIVYTTFK